jgi:hypothetical protein
MKKQLTLIVVVLCIFIQISHTNSQSIEWQNSYGGSGSDAGSSIINTSDGGLIIIGLTWTNDSILNNNGLSDFILTKLDSLGNLEWSKCYGGSNKDNGIAINKSNDGGYVIAGTTLSNDSNVTFNYGSYDFWIIKIDSIGTLEWEKSFGGSDIDVAWSISSTINGGYVVCGNTTSNDNDVSMNYGGYDSWIIKIDSIGTIEWEKSFGGSDNDFAESLIVTDSTYIIAGTTESNDGDITDYNGGPADAWVIKIDFWGNLIWQKCYGGSSNDKAHSIIQTFDGGYAIGGYTASNDSGIVGNSGGGDYWIIKTDSMGTIEWQKCIGGSDHEEVRCIKQLADSNYAIAGSSYSNDGSVIGNHGDVDAWVVKLDNQGNNIIWQRCLGGSQEDEAWSLTEMSDNSIVILGYPKSSNGDVTAQYGYGDIWVVKLIDTTNVTNLVELDSNGISIYPNPSNGLLKIHKDNLKSSQFLITNLLGKELFSSNLIDLETEFNLSLPAGVYICTIWSESEILKREKVVFVK